MKNILMTALGTVLFATVLATPAQAQKANNPDTYQLMCLHNKTNRTISFAYQTTGSTEWEEMDLAANNDTWISWSTSTQQKVNIRFDSDLSNNTDWEARAVTTSTANANDCAKYGSDFSFKWKSDTYIELYTGR